MQTALHDVPNWMNLPVRVLPEDVVSIELSDDEIMDITGYGDRMFDKDTIDRMPSQYNSSKGHFKTNPNTTGIKGEWAGVKRFAPEVPLSEFLNDRPWRMSDMGDAIFAGKSARIFDYKTRTRKVSVARLLQDDMYCAEMDAKFAKRDKYGYLQAFIFCVNNPDTKTIHLMGWLTADDFFLRSQVIPGGNPIPGYGRYYEVDILLVPYRRLRPMAELDAMDYFPITQEMTIAMREKWKQVGAIDARRYLQEFSYL